MIQIQDGHAYMKSTPTCPQHGRMRLHGIPPDELVWTCAGFDGEGCGHTILNNDVEWVLVGPITELNWSL